MEARIVARDRRGVKSIFDEAAEITSPEDRAAYLDSACGGDAGLRKMVDTLLLALDGAGSFLETTPAKGAEDPTVEPVERLAPDGGPARGVAEAKADAVTLTGQVSGSDKTTEGAEPPAAQGPTVSYHPASIPGSLDRQRHRRPVQGSARRSAKGGWGRSTSPSRPSP